MGMTTTAIPTEASVTDQLLNKSDLLKGTASEPVLSEAEWMPKALCSERGFSR